MTDPNAPNLTDADRAHNLYESGRTLMGAGELERAIQAFSDSVAIYPHFKCLELMGECFLALGHPTQAVAPLAAATTLNRQVRAPSLLAQALLSIGEYRRAAELATSVLARSPGNRVAQAVLANPSVRQALQALTDDGTA